MKNLIIVLGFITLFAKDSGKVIIKQARIKGNILEIQFCNQSDQKVTVPYLHNRVDFKNGQYLFRGFYTIKHDTLCLNLKIRIDSSVAKPTYSEKSLPSNDEKIEYIDKALKPHEFFRDKVKIDTPLNKISFLVLHYEGETYLYGFKATP